MKKLELNQMENLEVGEFWDRESSKMIRKQEINIINNILILIFCLVFTNFMFAQGQQGSVSISGPSTVEVGIPYNYTFTFNPQYPWNTTYSVQADSYVITEWIVQTGTNGQSASVPGYINTPSNRSSYYYDGTYDNSNSKTIPIQWGDGSFLRNDDIIVKVSGIYKIASTGENIGYFNYLEKIQSVTVERLIAPNIEGASPILSCNQTNQTYSFSNYTNRNQILWEISGGTIMGPANGTSVIVKPNLTGNFNISCTVKRSGANPNYSKTGSKTVTRISPTTTATIYGDTSLCSSSNYSVINLPIGHTFSSWSISNSSIATLSTTSRTITTLRKVGQGTVILTANILNSCNENIPITKTIYVGSPILPETAFVNGETYTGYNQTLNYTLSGGSINGGTSYQWSVDSPFNDGGDLSCEWQILGGQGTQTITLKSGCISTIVVVRVVATSSCGSSNTKYIYVTVGSNPCPPALRLSQNPIKDGNLVAKVTYPSTDCDTKLSIGKTINNEIKIYDFYGNVVYTSKQNSDELIINNLQIKKGIYLLQVITEKGEIIKDKIIIE